MSIYDDFDPDREAPPSPLILVISAIGCLTAAGIIWAAIIFAGWWALS